MYINLIQFFIILLQRTLPLWFGNVCRKIFKVTEHGVGKTDSTLEDSKALRFSSAAHFIFHSKQLWFFNRVKSHSSLRHEKKTSFRVYMPYHPPLHEKSMETICACVIYWLPNLLWIFTNKDHLQSQSYSIFNWKCWELWFFPEL